MSAGTASTPAWYFRKQLILLAVFVEAASTPSWYFLNWARATKRPKREGASTPPWYF